MAQQTRFKVIFDGLDYQQMHALRMFIKSKELPSRKFRIEEQ